MLPGHHVAAQRSPAKPGTPIRWLFPEALIRGSLEKKQTGGASSSRVRRRCGRTDEFADQTLSLPNAIPDDRRKDSQLGCTTAASEVICSQSTQETS